jgi:hypothetical protein
MLEGGPVTTNELEPLDDPEAPRRSQPKTGSRGLIPAGRAVFSRLLSHRFLALALAVAAVAAVVAGAYELGSPAGPAANLDAQRLAYLPADGAFSNGEVGQPVPAATAAPAGPVDLTGKGVDQGQLVPTGQPDQLLAAVDSNLIVKTGQLSLEVADLDKAVTQAQATIVGMGGSVSTSSLSGTGDGAVASATYRVPVARWDEALTALRKLGSKTLSLQTGTSDVTSQVVDLDARLTNLKTTESALQAIMARASAIPDVIAVENQLSQTQGQIEQLTAQRNYLSNQAAMSTLTVTFQLPGKTVTTQATQDWTLGNQVDEAAAALVRIGQGLATMSVWAIVVVLPIGFVALLLLAILALARRLLARRRRDSAATTA